MPGTCTARRKLPVLLKSGAQHDARADSDPRKNGPELVILSRAASHRSDHRASLPILNLAHVSVGIGKIGMREHPAAVAANHQFLAELCHGRDDSLLFFETRQYIAEVRHPALDARQFFLARLLFGASAGVAPSTTAIQCKQIIPPRSGQKYAGSVIKVYLLHTEKTRVEPYGFTHVAHSQMSMIAAFSYHV
jgi:hypothetical protein